jgi:hypothetical protein
MALTQAKSLRDDTQKKYNIVLEIISNKFILILLSRIQQPNFSIGIERSNLVTYYKVAMLLP